MRALLVLLPVVVVALATWGLVLLVQSRRRRWERLLLNLEARRVDAVVLDDPAEIRRLDRKIETLRRALGDLP